MGSPDEVVAVHKEHMAQRRAEAKEKGVSSSKRGCPQRTPAGPARLGPLGSAPATASSRRPTARRSAVTSANTDARDQRPAPVEERPHVARDALGDQHQHPDGRLMVTCCAITSGRAACSIVASRADDRAREPLGHPHLAGERRPDRCRTRRSTRVRARRRRSRPTARTRRSACDRPDAADVDLDLPRRRLADPAALHAQDRVGELGPVRGRRGGVAVRRDVRLGPGLRRLDGLPRLARAGGVVAAADADTSAAAWSTPSPSGVADGMASGSGSGAITPTSSGGVPFAPDRFRERFGWFGVASGIGADLGQRGWRANSARSLLHRVTAARGPASRCPARRGPSSAILPPDRIRLDGRGPGSRFRDARPGLCMDRHLRPLRGSAS